MVVDREGSSQGLCRWVEGVTGAEWVGWREVTGADWEGVGLRVYRGEECGDTHTRDGPTRQLVPEGDVVRVDSSLRRARI